MKTILYNIAQQEPLKNAKGQIVEYDGGFFIDGEKPNYPDIVELDVVKAIVPEYDRTTHRIVHSPFAADVENGYWHDTYTITPLTAEEIAAKTWKHTGYPEKLVIHQSVIFSADGAPFYAWFQLNGNPIEFDGTHVHVWITEVQPAHQATFDALEQGGLLTLETFQN